MSNFSYLSTHPRILHVCICRHRGRESVLYLPGDVCGGVSEGVGVGGEVDSEKVK